MRVYVLYCEEWTWTRSHYNTEFVCVYADEGVAQRRALELQGNCHQSTVSYRVEEVEYDGLIR